MGGKIKIMCYFFISFTIFDYITRLQYDYNDILLCFIRLLLSLITTLEEGYVDMTWVSWMIWWCLLDVKRLGIVERSTIRNISLRKFLISDYFVGLDEMYVEVHIER